MQTKTIERAGIELAGIGKVKKQQYGMKIPYGCYSTRNTLLELPAETLPLGKSRTLTLPELHIGNRDRIALTGDNGGGKLNKTFNGSARGGIPGCANSAIHLGILRTRGS